MYSFDTEAVRGRGNPGHAVSTPIFQTSTFSNGGEYSYSRVSNPTRAALEKTLAALEGGDWGFAFSSGLAAVNALFALLSGGDRAVISRDLYGGTYRLITELYNDKGIDFVFADTSNSDELRNALSKKTRLLFIETPSNPMMRVTDIRLAAKAARAAGAFFAVDNTFLTPYYQRPLSLGADAVLHSATKYLGGHHDAVAGALVTSDASAAERFSLAQRTFGAPLSPFDSFLVLRGIQTLPLRMQRHSENAEKVVRFLLGHTKVAKVYYAGLPDSPFYSVSQSQSSGFGGMISFEVKSASDALHLLSSVKLIQYAESLGGCSSLITYPLTQTHASIPESIRADLGITDRLLRLSVGIESPEDIISDLEQALG